MTLYIILVVIAVAWYIVFKLDGGCEGDCQQGRKPCNCPRARQFDNGSKTKNNQ